MNAGLGVLFSDWIGPNIYLQFLTPLTSFLYIFLIWYVILSSLFFQANTKKDSKSLERFQFVSGLLGVYQMWLVMSTFGNLASKYITKWYLFVPTVMHAIAKKVNPSKAIGTPYTQEGEGEGECASIRRGGEYISPKINGSSRCRGGWI